MRDIFRSVGDNVRNLLRQLKQAAPRFDSQISVRLSLLDYKYVDGKMTIPVMGGKTINMSATGLAMIVPNITLNDKSLIAKGTELTIVLDLPSGIIRLKATPIHHRRVSRFMKNSEYILGVQITEIEDDARARYLKYISRIERGEKMASKWADKSKKIA
jgi:hypothetical protein